MRRVNWLGMLLAACCITPVQAQDKALTLEEALAAADTLHPRLAAAQADLDLALAEQSLAESLDDGGLRLEGALRRGYTTIGENAWRDDHSARLVYRKTLLDFGRQSGFSGAASQEVRARRLALLDARDARRIDIMARYFDVLLADAQNAADNEYTAVSYVGWDDAKKRFELGELNPRDLAQMEARFQDQREKRSRSQLAMRSSRQKLANAMNQLDRLPSELTPPALPQNDLALPDYESLLSLAMKNNRHLLAREARLMAVQARMQGARADRFPTLDVELAAGDFSRDSLTRDRYSGGLVLNWPIYQGGRIDSRLQREAAQHTRLKAEWEQARMDLSEALLETLLEINWLKNAGRPAAAAQVAYRDQVLDRARAEYEMELKISLGNALADTQTAAIRQRQVEYRLALALARLEALIGKPLTEFAQTNKVHSQP